MYFKKDVLKVIVELFGYYFFLYRNGGNKLDFTYLDMFLTTRVSKPVKHEMVDYCKEFYDSLAERNINDTTNNIEKDKENRIKYLYNKISYAEKVELFIVIASCLIENDSYKKYSNQGYNVTAELNKIVHLFELDTSETDIVLNFLKGKIEDESTSSSIVVVGDFSELKLDSFKMLHRKNFSGKILSLFIPSLDSFLIKYHGRSNVRINRHVVFPGRIYQFSLGGVIENQSSDPLFFGDLYRSYFDEDFKGIHLQAKGIVKKFKGTNQGIKELSFGIEGGQLMAVMGGSGTGKTTLLGLLSGLIKPDSGSVLINGKDISTNLEEVKKYIGLVPQDDLLIEELTVYQNLKYSTQLCRDDLSKTEIDKLVTETLESLELANFKDLKVGSPLDKIISGGQRKRLNIALEVVRKPSILFVDEPTSGLSSSDAYQVTKLLRNIAKTGSIVIINIHQPTSEIFYMFNKLLLLDKGGYAAYYGNPRAASFYFKEILNLADSIEDDSMIYGHYNPEHLIHLLEFKKRSDKGEILNERDVVGKEWYDYFKSKNPKEETVVSKRGKLHGITQIPGILKQFLIFLERNIKTRLVDSQYIILVILGAPILAFLVSVFLKSTDIITHKYVFYDNENIPVYLFISVIVALFLGLILSSGEIHKDLKILKRETFLNLSIWSYVNSKVTYVLAVTFVQMTLYVLVGNSILEIKDLNSKYILVLWMTAFASSMMGLFLSARLKTILAIYIAIPFLLIPQILLAGAILDYDKVHYLLTSKKYVPIYADLNISRWSYESLAVLQFADNNYDKEMLETKIQQSDLLYYANLYMPRFETVYDEFIKNKEKESEELCNYMLYELNNRVPAINRFVSDIQKELSNTKLVYSRVRAIKKSLRKMLNEAQNNVEKDRKQLEGRFERQDYSNRKLTEMVLKQNNYQKFIAIDGEVIRKYHPGYYISDNKFGRSHYYAPYKKIGNFLISTMRFNITIIVIYAIVIYFLLILYLKQKRF